MIECPKMSPICQAYANRDRASLIIREELRCPRCWREKTLQNQSQRRQKLPNFPLHTPETAPQKARMILEQTQKRLGFIPTMYAKQAEAPVLLETYRLVDAAFETTSLAPTERLVVLMTVSRYHNCDFCMSAHSWRAQASKLPNDLRNALRAGVPTGDKRLDALADFAHAMVDKRGKVSNADVQAFMDAGFDHRQALEIIVGIAISAYIKVKKLITTDKEATAPTIMSNK